ncbi:hypothetical protein KGM_201529 [Danaus plexippus plexippus]|uniref:Uncharacterized protein n=1 Tax=Danaus plexippus plexippus TaxID=278856 RepID=A0A212EPA5_DANPL|nr:hypothetical protein KGM_201529 [Danaus plexippus plexippus]
MSCKASLVAVIRYMRVIQYSSNEAVEMYTQSDVNAPVDPLELCYVHLSDAARNPWSEKVIASGTSAVAIDNKIEQAMDCFVDIQCGQVSYTLVPRGGDVCATNLNRTCARADHQSPRGTHTRYNRPTNNTSR